MFEVYETQILESLPEFIEIILGQFKSAGELFRESVIRALLKVSLSICTFFYKFLNVEVI